MKVKNVNLEYYVFYMDFNSDQPKRMNILSHLEEDIAAHVRSATTAYQHISDKPSLKNYLKSTFMYHYWSKSEMEYCVAPLHNSKIEPTKLDVWYQIEPNLDLITDYIINKMCLFK